MKNKKTEFEDFNINIETNESGEMEVGFYFSELNE